MSDSNRNPERFLPLKPTVLHILLALTEQRSHGYQIMLTVAERSGGTVELSTAVLYRTLRRLLDQELIIECEDRPAAQDDDSRRRYYEITPLGRSVASLELRRLRSLLASESVGQLLGRPEPA